MLQSKVPESHSSIEEPNEVRRSSSKPQNGGGGKRSNMKKTDDAKAGRIPHSPTHNVAHGEANFAS
jgi:hypothetical protein